MRTHASSQLDNMIPHISHLMEMKFLLTLGGDYKFKMGQRSLYNHSTGSLIYSEFFNVCGYMDLYKLYISSFQEALKNKLSC